MHPLNNSGSVPNSYNTFSVILQDTVIGAAVSAISISAANSLARKDPVAASILNGVPVVSAVIWIFRRILGVFDSPPSEGGGSVGYSSNLSSYSYRFNHNHGGYRNMNVSGPSIPVVPVIESRSSSLPVIQVIPASSLQTPHTLVGTTGHRLNLVGPRPREYSQQIPVASSNPISSAASRVFNPVPPVQRPAEYAQKLPSSSNTAPVRISDRTSSGLNRVEPRSRVEFSQARPSNTGNLYPNINASPGGANAMQSMPNTRLSSASTAMPSITPIVRPGTTGERLNSVPKRD